MFNPQYYFRQTSYIGLLDIYPNASQAYSFRKLRNSYTGFCIRVMRTSDGATLDVGFVNGYLNIFALITFVGSSTGYIIIFYDQSGNAINLTGSAHFRIVNAGMLNLSSGKVFGEIIGSSFLATSFTAYSINSHSIFYTHNVKSVSSYSGIYVNKPTIGNGTMYASENSSTWRSNRIASLNLTERASNTRNARTTNKALPTGVMITNWNYDGNTTSSLLETNVTQTIGASVSGWGTSKQNSLGGFNGVHALQDIFEIIVYPTDKTSDSNAINLNIKNYYGL